MGKNKNRRRKNRRRNRNRKKNRRKSTTTLVPRIFASADREFVTTATTFTTTTTVFTPPAPAPEPEVVHGFVSFSIGDEEEINFNLGPGQADHAVDKLKQLEEALNCEGLACLDVKKY